MPSNTSELQSQPWTHTLGFVHPNPPVLVDGEGEKRGWDEEGGKCYEMFLVVVGTMPEASFKEDLGGESRR